MWLLLAPRDYLSTFMKLGTIFALALRDSSACCRDLQMPAMSRFMDGSGLVVAGQGFPVLLHHHRLRRDLRVFTR